MSVVLERTGPTKEMDEPDRNVLDGTRICVKSSTNPTTKINPAVWAYLSKGLLSSLRLYQAMYRGLSSDVPSQKNSPQEVVRTLELAVIPDSRWQVPTNLYGLGVLVLKPSNPAAGTY